MMSSHTSLPHPPFRSFSSASSVSLSGSTSSITRIASGPIASMNLNMNRPASKEDQIFYQCSKLKKRIEKIDGIEPYVKLAFEAAESCSEQQALALSQQLSRDGSRGRNDSRASLGSLGMASVNSNSSSVTSVGGSGSTSSIFTFTAGVLPANIGVDPVTQLWKLFQQGAPLCLIFNAVVSDYTIPVVASDDMRVCKKSVYDFLIALKTHLNFDDDSMFTISDIFSDSTHELIKVVRTVKKLLSISSKFGAEFDVDDLYIGQLAVSDDRSKVLKEVIETERKYVQDLELLLQYKDDLQQAELISSEQIHILFPNLNEIIDFQRRFLNGLESNVNVPLKYQRIGSIFIHAASGPFKAYEPWTVGQLSAIDLINKEHANLKKSSSLLDPCFELQSYIIKPIQRLCKYPLLLKELIKYSPQSNDHDDNISMAYNELLLAQSAIKEVANHVNEAQRRSENIGYLQSLVERVQNWRGFEVKDQGELLYHSAVGVRDSDNEREYTACLFEKIIFFFVESSGHKEKEGKKRRDILSGRKKSTGSSSSTVNILDTLTHAKEKAHMELKGRVYISEIYSISASNILGYTLIISWSGKKESGSFTLRFANEEIRNQWENCLRSLKSCEMNSQIHKKLAKDAHNSHISSGTNESSLYDLTSAYANSPSNSYTSPANDGYSRRSSNGSQRHHSSSSTFSMMRSAITKTSNDHVPSRVSSSSLSNPGTGFSERNESSFSSTSTTSEILNIGIKLIYGKIEIPELLIVPTTISYTELHSKISSKIASSSEINDDIMVNKLKYKDEDGDFVVMDSNDDWLLAVDMFDDFGAKPISFERCLTIWVS
ncbi:Piso0_005516 [Millerozyma farinosa CBS 7064]|uniref:Piso0_005516 protein n=1 Tax=Pichia sorbitophila (strain ATCC MYA-4447 / BCRC 22081 / CBS 7064 / NBRC 10061 / NRRL Y-12695) TaxID=559304 RepID=G8Y269_PICSO|nr:Piso0_005516 [Millerozyma farinosa CBS 7064]